jgi:predicted NUDIX family NTP pyrophosphohydrolase
MTRTEIDALLAQHNIPLETWGVGEAKTLAHLYCEIEAGECRLVEHEGSLLRLIAGVAVRIYHPQEGKGLILLEDRQIFSDGRIRRRQDLIGLGEKMKTGEDPIQAARRVFTEELQITEEVPLDYLGQSSRGPVTSNSFPGLFTSYETHLFDAEMPVSLYRDEYTEVQPDKTSFFVWTKTKLA